MECFDVHVALEACDIVIESATIAAILELKTKVLPLRGAAETTNELPGTRVSPGSTFCSR
jgi:hypothetical protein